ncbi:MAG TPA: hypothetical protein DHV16_09360 [Nitrospiraceae bacterium]|nr:MAG: hypothetical protein A2Z82_08520 [Nitrospirae bacterium GWA2_46_11]OGW25390.1 MAG: hypothetical protein A2X55_00800 [Nitrospirae bacterium GWB2_47_37]HAK87830.1 hypothetical protein [Nitrospiraceae bacterium]HCZ12437.1 hypothetical protein [Nitrospiraceae bacterium]
MEIGTMIKALQDPMGIPFYPVLFQVLMVLTFALHIMFVNFVLGTSFLSVYGYIKGDDYWKRLSKSMIRATTANISMAILLGVAPLLFVQVVYDPFWYASNMISGAWVMAFILIMMLGYSMVYVFYLKRDSRGGGFAAFGIGALALFILAGIIMHVLGYQLLQPEKWFGWYISGNSIDTSGTALHTFHIPRFLHFMIPSFALTGVFLMLYAWYFKDRADSDKEYLQWVARMGAKMAFVFTAIQAGVGFWWLFSLPLEFKFFVNPFFLVGAGLGVSLLFFLNNAQKDPFKYAVPAVIGAFLTVFGMSYTREALRMTYLRRFDYSIFDYKLNIDLGSTALFLSTFVMGLIIAGYMLTIAYKSGKTTGEYVPSPSIDKWGKISIALLLAWIVVVVSLGVVTSVRNYL